MSKVEKVAFRPRHRRQASRRAEREEGLRTPHPARVARLLALVHDIEARIEAGEFRDYADVARAHGLTRARLTQVMNLLPPHGFSRRLAAFPGSAGRAAVRGSVENRANPAIHPMPPREIRRRTS